MATTATWTDLLDPDEARIREAAPASLHPRALARLAEPPPPASPSRPTLESHGDYVLGVFLVPVAVPAEDRVFYREVDVVLTRDSILTVRKTPPGEEPFDTAPVRESCRLAGVEEPGAIAYRLVDAVAEGFLDLVDSIEDEIEELEDHVDAWPNEKVRERLSELRHDVLQVRRTLSPTRDALRRVVDGRIDLEGEELCEELFDRDVELSFADAYDKLLRATEGLDFRPRPIASVRDYHQAKVTNEQNEVIKKLTVIASLLLFPTFIVGVYGQNFEHMPELGWKLGYLFSWAVVVVVTLAQLAFFRWRKWI